jgi:hypothetical protein
MPEQPNDPQPQPNNLPATFVERAAAVITEQPCVFGSAAQFELGQRMARALAASDMVPAQYKDKTANCMIALDIALQRRLSPLTVMQNLSIIQGRPAWSASFIIASINASGLFSPLRYEWVAAQGSDDWGCRATATDLRSGDRIEGTLINIRMAKAEGWYSRNGSKWQTMPEQMLRYRAGSFFGRIYAGHITLGLPTTDELIDNVIDVTPPSQMNPFAQPFVPPSGGNGVALESDARAREAAAPADAPRRNRNRNRNRVAGAVDVETGEVSAPETPAARAQREAREAAAATPAPAPVAAPVPPAPLNIPDSGLEPAPPRNGVVDDPLF